MNPQRKRILLLLAINVLLRGVWLAWLNPPQHADFEWYFHHAASMAAGFGYMSNPQQPTAYWPIGWPFILSILFRVVGPSVWSGKILNTLFSVGIVLLIYALTARLTKSSRIAFAAALGYSLLPSQIEWNAMLGSEESFTFVLLLSLLVYLYSYRPRFVVLTALSGLLLGLACDIRPIPLLFPVVVLIYEWWLNRRAIGHALQRFGAYAAGMAAGIAPVTIRNWIAMHHFILVSTNGGVNLWQGLHTNSGYYWRWYGNPLLRHGYNELSENRIGELLFKRQLLHHPLSVLWNGILKVYSLYRNDVNATFYTFGAAHHPELEAVFAAHRHHRVLAVHGDRDSGRHPAVSRPSGALSTDRAGDCFYHLLLGSVPRLPGLGPLSLPGHAALRRVFGPCLRPPRNLSRARRQRMTRCGRTSRA